MIHIKYENSDKTITIPKSAGTQLYKWDYEDTTIIINKEHIDQKKAYLCYKFIINGEKIEINNLFDDFIIKYRKPRKIFLDENNLIPLHHSIIQYLKSKDKIKYFSSKGLAIFYDDCAKTLSGWTYPFSVITVDLFYKFYIELNKDTTLRVATSPVNGAPFDAPSDTTNLQSGALTAFHYIQQKYNIDLPVYASYERITYAPHLWQFINNKLPYVNGLSALICSIKIKRLAKVPKYLLIKILHLIV